MNIPGASSNITPTAGTVLWKVQGGNTETAIKPAGTRAKEAARVGLGLVGSPPPPGSPGWGASASELPGVGCVIINARDIARITWSIAGLGTNHNQN